MKKEDYWEGIYWSKKDKTILRLIFGTPLVLGIIFIIYNFVFGKSGKESFLEEKSKLYFNGKIVSEYRQWEHNIKVAVLNDGYEYPLMGEWEKFIHIGDSISKEKDSLYIILINGTTGERLKLDYREAVKKWRSDFIQRRMREEAK
ncbi:MAG: hypothetical protein LBQ84_09580 [Flavobacteriaceae bacterium]|jgi:tryptophan synthase alpha subunit|nr:hypothetical protein [Flavobacteriaceae bacterium]